MTNVPYIEWELLQSPIEAIDLPNSPSLQPAAKAITISRDESFNIEIFAESDLPFPQRLQNNPAGSIAHGVDIEGIQAKCSTIKIHDAHVGAATSGSSSSKYEIRSQKVSERFPNANPPAKVIEYFLNGIDSWSDFTNRSSEAPRKIVRSTPGSIYPNHWTIEADTDDGIQLATDTMFLKTKYGEFLLAKVPTELCKERFRPTSLTFPPEQKFFDSNERKKSLMQ
ncbi:MAG: hypothetical protein EOO88_28980 [Pedobacter sp.]|nr:MAG: hypothetical protein EOO88_28980 [Pedobacter sp.]